MLDELTWDAAGLVTVVVQDRRSGEIRMLAHADREAVEATLQTGLAHFFSRSRRRLWKKGESSGHVLRVFEVWADCDEDALVYLAEADGPSCHTGTASCFFRRLDECYSESDRALPILAALTQVLRRRATADVGKSYTRSLLAKGPSKVGEKLREEADELANALGAESDARVVNEAADLLYHTMVGLELRGLTLDDVARVLAGRMGVSGHEEKAARQG